MNSPSDIICFSKDWEEPKTSNNHLMEEMARTHRVLWVNSITTRSPNLRSANDLRKMARKIYRLFRGIKIIHNNLRVVTPIVLPFPRSRWAQRINRTLVRRLVKRAMYRWQFENPELWIFPPNAVDYIGQFGESKRIYYCVDEWSLFTHLDADFIRQKERALLRQADVVFVVSEKLRKAKALQNANTYLIPHGVPYALFSQALAEGFPAPEVLRDIPHPIIGFYGTLYHWVDQELVAGIARLRPAWSIVLVGKAMTDLTIVRKLPNIHIFESYPYQELPQFCKGFDVGIIPYRLQDPRMQSVNPLKLREYLAAGLPVVSVDLPEVRGISDDVFIAQGAHEFVKKIGQALKEDSPARKYQRSKQMAFHSWEARVSQIEQILRKGGGKVCGENAEEKERG